MAQRRDVPQRRDVDDGGETPEEHAPRVCVLAGTPLLTVTVEAAPGSQGPELHVHPGGQGMWVARMARSLGAEVVVCGPFGGETGHVAAHLAEREGLQVRAVRTEGSTGSYVHDRRRGERTEIVRVDPAPLGRHDQDDLYGAVLVEALDADVVVLGGAEPAGVVPADFLGRLAGDLRAAGCTVVADLSGDAARAVLETGVDVLKMSDAEMHESGFSASTSTTDLRTAARQMVAAGVGAVVVSRAPESTLLVTADDEHQLCGPQVTSVEHRGAGDSMTAAIAVARARGRSLVDAVSLGVAAGALNVARHGLGTGHADQVERLAREVTVDRVHDADDA